MLTSPKEVEDSVQRLAQMARAVGFIWFWRRNAGRWMSSTGVSGELPARIALSRGGRHLIRVLCGYGGA